MANTLATFGIIIVFLLLISCIFVWYRQNRSFYNYMNAPYDNNDYLYDYNNNYRYEGSDSGSIV